MLLKIILSLSLVISVLTLKLIKTSPINKFMHSVIEQFSKIMQRRIKFIAFRLNLQFKFLLFIDHNIKTRT